MTFWCFFFILISLFVENKTMISSSVVSRGRSQSMRPLLQRSRSDTVIKPQTASSNSAVTTLSHTQINTKTNPVASTSSAKSTLTRDQESLKTICETCTKKEKNQQHVPSGLDEVQNMRSLMDINLSEVSVGTNSEHLIPSRDGVYARLRRVLLQHGVAVAIGSGIGVGAIELMNVLNTTTIATPTTTTTTTSTTTQEPKAVRTDEEITNPL